MIDEYIKRNCSKGNCPNEYKNRSDWVNMAEEFKWFRGSYAKTWVWLWRQMVRAQIKGYPWKQKI